MKDERWTIASSGWLRAGGRAVRLGEAEGGGEGRALPAQVRRERGGR